MRSAIGAHFRLPIFTSISWDEIPTLISDESAIFLADNNIANENVLTDFKMNPDTNEDSSIKDNLDAHNEQIQDDTINELIDQTKTYKSTAKTKLLVKQLVSQLPVKPYYALDFTEKEVVFVIGGETEGISLESCKLLRSRNCTRVNIPLTNGVDSLNVSVAVGIITFEIRRQFVTHKIEDE